MALRTGLAFLAMLVACDAALAADGDLDPTFGIGGRVREVFPPIGRVADIGVDFLVQPDGRFVATATPRRRLEPSDELTLALARFAPDGSLDRTFGTDGRVQTDLGCTEAHAGPLVRDPDGRLVVAAQCDDRLTLVRFTAGGVLDTQFGAGGRVDTGATCFVSVEAFSRQPDGKLVLGVTCDAPQGPREIAVFRFTENGSPDASFGTGGRRALSFTGNENERINALALEPDGKIVVAGNGRFSDTGVMAVIRLLADGTHDSTFGDGGKTTIAVGMGADGNALILQPDGKIVVGGDAFLDRTTQVFAVARLTAAGTLDPGFGDAGVATTVFATSDEDGASLGTLVLQRDGKIVAAGFGLPGGDLGSMVGARYTPAGALDTSFGNGGRVVIDYGEGADGTVLAVASAIQDDGKIVLAGYASSAEEPGLGLALVRLLGTPIGSTCGDADGSGTVSVTDGVQTLRAAADLSSVCMPATCDVDGSGVVTVTDGVNVLRSAAGLLVDLRCSP
jgi:uncharacterized delta-60 repeat protein